MGSLSEFYVDLMMAMGLGNIITRTITLGGIGFAFQYFIKPSISYTNVSTKGGNRSIAKEFAFTSKAAAPMTTYFPWYFWPLGLMLLSVFIL